MPEGAGLQLVEQGSGLLCSQIGVDVASGLRKVPVGYRKAVLDDRGDLASLTFVFRKLLNLQNKSLFYLFCRSNEGKNLKLGCVKRFGSKNLPRVLFQKDLSYRHGEG